MFLLFFMSTTGISYIAIKFVSTVRNMCVCLLQITQQAEEGDISA